MSFYRSRRPTTDETLILDVRVMRRRGWLRPHAAGPLEWTRGGEVLGSVECAVSGAGRAESLELSYVVRTADGRRDVRRCIPLVWTPCHYGGERVWFLCPACGRRIAIVYGLGGEFRCRLCHGLSYPSQHDSRALRLLRRAQKIRMTKLGAAFDEAAPPRPPGMHRATYWRLLEQADEFEWAGTLELGASFGLRLGDDGSVFESYRT